MAESVSIMPLALYNGALTRQGIKLKVIVDDDGNPGITPLDESTTVEDHVSDLVNRLVALDQLLGLVLDSNVHAFANEVDEISTAWKQGYLKLGGDYGNSLEEMIAALVHRHRALRKIVADSSVPPAIV